MQKYRLSDNELTLWLKYIEHQVGFVLPNSQLSWIKGVIERFLYMHECTSTELLENVVRNKTLYHEVFDDILIPRTQFFRHLGTFEFIEEYAKAWQQHYAFKEVTADAELQDIAIIASQTQLPLFTAWSVGCSSGQEAVSTLLILDEVLGERNAYKVFGSDFHQQALQQAKDGRYDIAEQKFIPSQFHSQFLVVDDTRMELKTNLKRHLQYFSKNLVDYQHLLPISTQQCQVIICENVLIYFRQFEQRDILNFLTQYLADDGILLLSAGQSVSFSSPELQRFQLANVNGFCRKNAPDWLQRLVNIECI